MIVQLGQGSLAILEADDCRRLHVAAPPDVDVDAILRSTGVGRGGDRDDVRLDVEKLHELARGAATGDTWDADWAAMIQYAESKGWVTADGRELIAHVEVAQA